MIFRTSHSIFCRFILESFGYLHANQSSNNINSRFKTITGIFRVGQISHHDMQRDPPFLSELGTVGETLC